MALAVINPALVLRDSVELLHHDASIRQFVNRPLEVLDGQIENRVGGANPVEW